MVSKTSSLRAPMLVLAQGSGCGKEFSWTKPLRGALRPTSQYAQEVIEEALAEEADAVIPELVRLAELRVEIPRYQTAMIAKLASRENLSVDEIVSRQFLDLASAESEWLAKSIPGFDAALRWPEA